MAYLIVEPRVDVLDKAGVDECVDGGACEPVCRVEAIDYEDDVPATWAPYPTINAGFVAELGCPGGTAKVGTTAHDPPFVRDLPRHGPHTD